LVNILLNAIDATGDAQEKLVVVAVEKCTEQDLKKSERNSVRKGDWVKVTFSDKGCGIRPDMQDRIFEPFITTKGLLGGGDDSAPGTGLGLSISYGIMQRHNGLIWAENNNGEGTTFTVAFPLPTIKK